MVSTGTKGPDLPLAWAPSKLSLRASSLETRDAYHSPGPVDPPGISSCCARWARLSLVCRWRRSRLARRVHVRDPGAMHGFGIRPVEHDVRHQSARAVQAAAPAWDKEVAGTTRILAAVPAGNSWPALKVARRMSSPGEPRCLARQQRACGAGKTTTGALLPKCLRPVEHA